MRDGDHFCPPAVPIFSTCRGYLTARETVHPSSVVAAERRAREALRGALRVLPEPAEPGTLPCTIRAFRRVTRPGLRDDIETGTHVGSLSNTSARHRNVTPAVIPSLSIRIMRARASPRSGTHHASRTKKWNPFIFFDELPITSEYSRRSIG
ncbi:hypothetical protein [Burkholderia anthina]|uniref:hypothetical protein n=1 Tax=Burkholderia anthina TaxID=179879 RepID=UPI00158D7066|nr:hypothetical protein [Burkholderia anthina]